MIIRSSFTRLLPRWTALLAGAISLLAVACGSGDGAGDSDGSPAGTLPSSGKLSGDIRIDGSSTVFPISQAVAEEFSNEHGDVNVTVGVSGTGGGFKRFVSGETDISNASRTIKASEAQEAANNGVEYYEFQIAFDGLSVMVHPDNDFVTCMTTGELRDLWHRDSTVERWSDIRAEWPSDKIDLYGPDTDSGTFDYFIDEIVEEEDASRADYTASSNDNILVAGIGGDENSLGYFGYAYYTENPDKLKLVAVDSGQGCVEPTHETILGGDYFPLSRPLFIYVSKEELERPEMRAFVKFYMENAFELSNEVGYVGLDTSVYEENLAMIGF